MSCGISSRWGEFSLLNLVVPGSSIHTANSLTGGLPVSGFSGELLSSTGGVIHVVLKIFSNLIFQSESFVNVIINVSSDIISGSVLSISDKGLWLHHGSSVLWSSHGDVELLKGISVSLEFGWPLSLSGGLESSFLGSNRSLEVDEVFLEFLSGLKISGLSISPVTKDGFLVTLSDSPISGGGVLVEMDLGRLVVPGSSVLLVDLFFLSNISSNFLFESGSLSLSVVNELEDISNDGMTSIVSSVIK